jgi:hypothetical protein
MNYYLKITNLYFIDPRGTWDEAGTVKEVVSCTNEIDEDLVYGEMDLNPEETVTQEMILQHAEEFEEEYGCKLEDWEPTGSEDGYNSETTTTTYKKITLDEYLAMNLIINNYNSL